MTTRRIVGAISAGILAVMLAAGPATATSTPNATPHDARTTSCTPGALQTKELHHFGGGGFTSKYGYLASVDSHVTFTYDGCEAHVLDQTFESHPTVMGERYEYRKVDSYSTVDSVPLPHLGSVWTRVTQVATYHSRYTTKKFTTDFVYYIHADGTYTLSHRGLMPDA